MSRRPTFFGFLIVFSVVISQFSTAQVNTGYVQSGVPAVSGPTIFVGQGPSTPTTTFAAPAPTAGISDAGRAGISNQAPAPPVLPASTDTVVYYTQPGVQTIVTSPSGADFVAPVTGVVENPAPVETAPEATGAGPEEIPQQGAADQSSRNDLGPWYFANTGPKAGGVSLGEISARFKAQKSMHNPRQLTNEDALRLKTGQ